MEPKRFGINLKKTGADPVHDKGFTSVSSGASSARKTSYTPLKPANVHDLKAMFDDKKGGTAPSSGASSPRSGAVSPRSGTTSPRSGSSSPGHAGVLSKKSDPVTLTSPRGLPSSSAFGVKKGGAALDSKSSLTKLSSGGVANSSKTSVRSSRTSVSSRDEAFPSRINITTTTTSSSSSTRNGDRSVTGRSWSPKSREVTKTETKISPKLKSSGLKSGEKKDENIVEIPVQHVNKKNPRGPYDNKSKFESSSTSSSSSLLNRTSGKETGVATVKTFQGVSSSRLGSDKKGRLSPSSTTASHKFSLDQNSASNKTGTREVTCEIPVQRVSDSNKTDKGNVKTTAQSKNFTRGDSSRSSGHKSSSLGMPSNPEVSDPRMMTVRKMSSERFERLKFDFERGVPTESQEKMESETTDHIELQLKARDLHPAKAEPVEEKPLKEESIFAKGMKVSDFVKHINTVHPPSHPDVKKFKTGGPKTLHTSLSDPGGENEYIEMPEGGAGDEIYEFVGEGEGAGDRDVIKAKSSSLKTPGRRHGVYR
ncbi:hypothetical protein ACOMHN_012645 [Nucella lapillus]